MQNYETTDNHGGAEANNTDKVWYSPARSDQNGPDPSLTDNDEHSPTLSMEQQHVLTTNETVVRFKDAGLARSQRSIERYCSSRKLDCIKDPDEGRHYITPESVDRLIVYLKELQTRHERGSESIAAGPDQRRKTVGPRQEGDDELLDSRGLRARMERFQRESAFKEMYIDKLEEEREKDKERLVDLGRQVGELSSELRLQSPQTNDFPP